MSTAALRAMLQRSYAPGDYPALARQAAHWQTSRPFAGMRLLDATPVFGNTVAKYLPLVAGGADLSVAVTPLFPHDPGTAEALRRARIAVVSESHETFDAVMDCAGVLARAHSRCGFVELTKSGEHVYADCGKPVILVDDSRIKLIETSLGTGDGFLRALAHFGHPELAGRAVVVFGAGKVGSGAALFARNAGAVVTVIDPQGPPVKGCLTARTQPEIDAAIATAWCVVSATGVAGALTPLTAHLLHSSAILANLGAEDEFGPDMPASRVLNDKLPVNFALREPTHLRYLDATMALVNECALALLTRNVAPGLNKPPQDLEDEILGVVRSSGIAAELRGIEEDFL